MTNRGQRMATLLGLLMVAGPRGVQGFEVMTLISPNEEEFGNFGEAVAGAGDVNGDGVPDLIVGARGEDPGNSPSEAGRAYVFSGQDGSLLLELVSPNEETNGVFGDSVDGAGDVNRDGVADLIVGASFEDPGGRAYVFSGQHGGLLHELISPNEEIGGRFGSSVAGAGDVNQDGFVDLMVAAPYEGPDGSPRNAGRTYVFSGKDGNLLLELKSPNEDEDEDDTVLFGYSVASLGDLNQDGSPDLLIGAPFEEPDGAYVFSGLDGSLIFHLVTGSTGSRGRSVAGAGDVNQDGFPDGIIGNSASACVFSGQDGSLLYELLGPAEPRSDRFGYSVNGPGDVTGDAIPDLLVGDPFVDTSQSNVGRAYVIAGHDANPFFELASPNEERGGNFGYFVAAAGDVNHDGLADLIVGAPGEAPGTSPADAGRAYVFLSPGMFRINSGGPYYRDIVGSAFVGDRAYSPGGFGYVGGLARHFDQPIGGTDDDPLYQDVRVGRRGDSDGIFSYRFDVSPGLYDVTLYLMAPALDGPGNVVMDVKAEEDVAFDDLDVTTEAGGEYQALVKTFTVDVTDGTLDLRFRAENKAAVVSAIAVAAQAQALGRGEQR